MQLASRHTPSHGSKPLAPLSTGGTLAILGRQAKLALAELESVLDAGSIEPVSSMAAFLHRSPNPQHLGGITRLANPITKISSTNWPEVTKQLSELIPGLIGNLPEGKIKIGLSVYGFNVKARQITAAGLEIKKVCRNLGRSARLVPNKEPTLNSAQVLHNGLLGNNGLELLIVKAGNFTLVARTTWVQDIDDYAKRDFDRPKRDAFVGMLPPKLAQTMINLAAPQPNAVVLDPFCGTGVLLQEALLMGYAVYGSDLNPKMIDYSRTNLEWLEKQYRLQNASYQLEVADATSHQWQPPVSCVASESYLGQPLSGLPKPERLDRIVADCNTIASKFLTNLRPQLASGARVCIAFPAWRVSQNELRHLPMLDRLKDLGYNRVRFQHASREDLVYFRPDQIVARELTVLTVTQE